MAGRYARPSLRQSNATAIVAIKIVNLLIGRLGALAPGPAREKALGSQV